jgi:hydrogenase nickel incorporation protein HypA/HybF
MHEAAIAAGILEVAGENAAGRPIQKVGLRLGRFTGVVREALEFAFEALTAGTKSEGARLEIEEVPLVVSCPVCKWAGRPAENFCMLCPQCGAAMQIVTGREMEVVWVDVE